MVRTSPQIKLEEISVDQFTDIHARQQSARDPPTFAFVDVKQQVIESNFLEIKDGLIQKGEKHE